MSRLTIGVNLLWLVPDEVGGSEQATVAGLRALRDHAADDLDVQLFALPSFAAAFPDVAAAYAVHTSPVSGRSRAVRVAAEATWLVGRSRGFDLVHHAGGTAPLVGSRPYILTLHDLQPLERVATHSALKRAYLGSVLPRSARSARAVIVPSEFVRQSVLSHFGLDPAAVVSIPHCVVASGEASTAEGILRARHDLPGPVVLYPAITYPHKNHVTLIDAFVGVRASHPDAVLVLPGGIGACESEIERQVQRLGLAEGVRRLGRIDEADKAGLLALATVVTVPSTYEGFGLPAAEAMQAGVALVAARAAALPEVVGDAGVLVEPLDAPGWTAAIVSLLDDPAERARLVALGRERVARVAGPAHAAATVALYRKVATSG